MLSVGYSSCVDTIKIIIMVNIATCRPSVCDNYRIIICSGLLIDQLIRRVDPKHRSLQQYFKEELADPHGMEYLLIYISSETAMFNIIISIILLDGVVDHRIHMNWCG